MPLPSPVAQFPDMSSMVQQNQARSNSLLNAAWAQGQNFVNGRIQERQQAQAAALQNDPARRAELYQASMQYMDGFGPKNTGYADGMNDWGRPKSRQDAASAAIPKGEMASRIKSGLLDRGMPEHIADGFLMNFQDESGLNLGINEQNPLVPGSRGGFGLYQVTGDRRVAYENFAKQRGTGLDDLDTTLDNLMRELSGPEKAAAQKIFASQTAGEAGAMIVDHFLRPAEEHRNARRQRYLRAN